ncbi:MAG: DUF4115 domain-containing protein [Porticoccaceae bacterium]|nr:DUF4115 domain-containing protein [Porticoccaceae bacterium]
MKHDTNKAKQGIAPPDSHALENPGQALRNIRMAKGIPDDYVQRQLGLGESTFHALETDDHRRLPSPVFVKGYLRRYAELMAVRPAPVLASYQRFLEREGLAAAPPAPPVDRPLIAMAGSAIALLLATSLVFGAILVDDGAEINSQFSGTEEIDSRDDNKMPGAYPQASGDAVKTENTFHLSFATDSWVEVVDARDHILAVSLQRAGDSLQLEGVPPFKITLGYGPGVTLTYLDEPVPLQPDPETFAVEMTLGQ